MRIATLFLAVTVFALPLAAQEGEKPAGWEMRLDRANADPTEIKFVTMEPGWHITTGPAAIFYDPSRAASGEYRVETEIFLFDPGRRQREAFGVFIGGNDLAGEDQAYLYFLIRNDGNYLIKRRDGSETPTITPWTPHPAIVRHDGSAETAKNTLAIDVGAEQLDFYLNGEKVTSLPRSELGMDGIVGLRVNHSLNVHVSKLTVEPHSGGGH
jgi:hypothetical protein